MSVIEVHALSCKSGRQYLLKNINWNVEKGEHCVIFGMNGSGKTTLLSTIAGYKKYHKGSVKILGQTYSEDNIIQLRKDVGFVSGSFFDKIFKNETVLQIILSGLNGTFNVDQSISGEDVIRAKKYLKEFRLIDKVNHPYCYLSKGQQQTVLVIRALMSNPKILLLDESCSGLDVYARDYLLNVIDQIGRKTEMTLVYVTHYPEEILPIFKHILLLKKSEVFAQGNIQELFQTDTIAAFFDNKVRIDKENDRFYIRVDSQQDIKNLDLQAYNEAIILEKGEGEC